MRLGSDASGSDVPVLLLDLVFERWSADMSGDWGGRHCWAVGCELKVIVKEF